MSFKEKVFEKVDRMPEGSIFGYRDLLSYDCSQRTITRAVNELLASGKIKKLEKGKFYRPKAGVLGEQPLSEKDIVNSFLYENGSRVGYITGQRLFNSIGISTQVPKTITIATNGSRREKSIGNVKLKITKARTEISEKNVKFLQLLDILSDIKSIPDSSPSEALANIFRRIQPMDDSEKEFLLKLSKKYSASTRALAAMIATSDKDSLAIDYSPKKYLKEALKIKREINPTTKYQVGLNPEAWPKAKEWNIF